MNKIKPPIIADYKQILEKEGNTFTKAGIFVIVKLLNEIYETDKKVTKKYSWRSI